MPRKSMQCSEGAFGAFSAPTTCSPSNNSFYDASPHADAEVERILQKGFTQELKSWEDLVAELGPDVVVDKLGCVLKVKISGNIKARLVTDLRRPGGNGRLKIRERVVLPRVLDLVYSILRLVEYWGDITRVELAAIEFSDAFHTIFLRMASAPVRLRVEWEVLHPPAVTRRTGQCTAGLSQACRSGLSADAGDGNENWKRSLSLVLLPSVALPQRCQGKAIPSHLAEVQPAATPCQNQTSLWLGQVIPLDEAGLGIVVPLKRQV